jgi:hypothetical protein
MATATDQGALEALNHEYIRSVSEADVRWFDANLSDDFVNSNPDCSLVDRAGFLAQIGRGSTVKSLAIEENRYSKWARENECKLISTELASFRLPWLGRYDVPPQGGSTVLVIDPVPPPTEKQMLKGLRGKDFEAHVVVGAPIPWQDLASRRVEDQEAVRELTSRIEEGLRGVTVNLEGWEDAPLVECAEAVWSAERGAPKESTKVTLPSTGKTISGAAGTAAATGAAASASAAATMANRARARRTWFIPYSIGRPTRIP